MRSFDSVRPAAMVKDLVGHGDCVFHHNYNELTVELKL